MMARKNGETRKPTYQKWWLDFQGLYESQTIHVCIIYLH